MMETDLKYYTKYLKLLHLYAKAIRIKVVYTSKEDSDGTYLPTLREIRLDPDLSESTMIAALLHELGHVLDCTLLRGKTFRQMEKAYTRIYTRKYTKRQKQIVLKAERRAWGYGKVIAKILGIRLGKWYDDYRQYCLKDYLE